MKWCGGGTIYWRGQVCSLLHVQERWHPYLWGVRIIWLAHIWLCPSSPTASHGSTQHCRGAALERRAHSLWHEICVLIFAVHQVPSRCSGNICWMNLLVTLNASLKFSGSFLSSKGITTSSEAFKLPLFHLFLLVQLLSLVNIFIKQIKADWSGWSRGEGHPEPFLLGFFSPSVLVSPEVPQSTVW